MNFFGEVALLDPAVVLQMTSHAKLTGVVKFVTLQDAAGLYFQRSDLKFATMDGSRRERLGDFLVRKRFLSMEQRDDALSKALKEGEKIGQIMVKYGMIEHSTLVNALRTLMKEVVFDVLRWKKGYFLFFNEFKLLNEEIQLDEKLDYLILEGMRRIDESQ